MRRIMIAVAVLAVGLAGCTADQDSPADCDAALDQAFRAWERAGFSGAVAIATGGRWDCLAGYGYADARTGTRNTPETVYSIGSVTKAVTAAAVLQLAEAGRLSLDDRAGEFLPELTGPAADATVAQLLRHTSGLHGTFAQDYQPLGPEQAIAAIGRLELAFEPGTDYAYANAGYTLLALIIERVTDAGYRDYLTYRVLRLPGGEVAGGFWNGEPAAVGPRAVGYLDGGRTGERGDFAGPHWALDGNGGVAMTVADLATWTRALFTGQLVSAASVEILTTGGYDLGEGRTETPGWVAVDESVHGTSFLATAGGGGDVGHNAVVVWVPERERVLALVSNRPEVSAEELLTAVGPAWLAGDPLPTPDVPSGGDPAAIVGTYRLGTGGSFEVVVEDGRPVVRAVGVDAVAALFPLPTGERRAHEDLVLELLAGETGEGQQERAALVAEFGEISEVGLAGTVRADGELRTYVTLATAGGPVTGWYAVDRHGGIKGAEVPTGPPTVRLVPAGDDRYQPDDPSGSGPEVTLAFRAGEVAITGPDGVVVAERTG